MESFILCPLENGNAITFVVSLRELNAIFDTMDRGLQTKETLPSRIFYDMLGEARKAQVKQDQQRFLDRVEANQTAMERVQILTENTYVEDTEQDYYEDEDYDEEDEDY